MASVCKSGDKPKVKKDSSTTVGSLTVDSLTVGQFFPIRVDTSQPPLSPHPSCLPGPSTWPAAWTRRCSAPHPRIFAAASWSFPPNTPNDTTATHTTPSVPCQNRFAALYEEPCLPITETGHHTTSDTPPPHRTPKPEKTKPVLTPTCAPPLACMEDSTSTPPTCTADLEPILASLRSNPSVGSISTIPLPHQVHSIISGWLATKPANSPSLTMEVSLDRSAYAELSVPMPRMQHNRSKPGRCSNKSCVHDTGAQLTVVPPTILHSLGIKQESILPVLTRVNGTSTLPISIEGGVLLIFSGKHRITAKVHSTRQLAYVSSSVDQIYLSRSACSDLRTIPSTFPELGAFCNTPQELVKLVMFLKNQPQSKLFIRHLEKPVQGVGAKCIAVRAQALTRANVGDLKSALRRLDIVHTSKGNIK